MPKPKLQLCASSTRCARRCGAAPHAAARVSPRWCWFPPPMDPFLTFFSEGFPPPWGELLRSIPPPRVIARKDAPRTGLGAVPGGVDAFREVTMIEVKEALRQWTAGAGKKRIGARVGLDPKTVRRYVRAGEACGLAAGQGESALTDEVLDAVLATLRRCACRRCGACSCATASTSHTRRCTGSPSANSGSAARPSPCPSSTASRVTSCRSTPGG